MLFCYSVKVMNLLPEGLRGGAIPDSVLLGGSRGPGSGMFRSGPAIRSQKERHFR